MPPTPRPFELEDARKALAMRTYLVTIEKKVLALVAGDETGDNYTNVVNALRTFLSRIKEIEDQQRQLQCRCWEGYECCNGICEPWCS